ncbi:poly(beta-D-mannuronate) C5 epimerase, partial [Pseudomonas coronafaciens]
MNSQASNGRSRNWSHALLESAVLTSALLMASSLALANAPVVPETPKLVKGLQQAKTYTITSPPTAPLEMAKPMLPDLSGYTAEAALKKIVRNKPGKVTVSRMMEETGLKEFIGGDNKMTEWVARQKGIPQAIMISDGYVSLQDLAKKVPKQFLNEVSPGVYVARLPILVKETGIFEIDSKTKELRLSQEKGSFIVSEGKMLITTRRST